jgi:hypothetical protein
MSNADLVVTITGDPSGVVKATVDASNAVRSMGEEMHHISGEFASEAAAMVSGFFTVEKAIEGVVAGIRKADEIRDLGNSLAVFTGSTQKAGEVIGFFEQHLDATRNTTEELARSFRNDLPLAISKGFSQESMQSITLWLSQLATISGHTLDEMETGFRQLLAGRVSPGRNPLMQVLGITKEQVNDLGWTQVVTKMEEVAQHFPEFGQSWESTVHKMKEEMLTSFGEGFNEAMDENGRKAMGGLLGAFTSDEAVSALHNTGKFIGKIISGEIADALVAIHLDDWLARNLDLTKQFHFTGSSLIPPEGQVYDQGHRDMFGQWQPATNPYPGTEGPNTYARQQGAAAMRSVGITHAPEGYDYNQYADTLGAAMTEHRDKSGKILAFVKDEVRDNTVAWTNLTSSIAEAIKVVQKTDSPFKSLLDSLGKVKSDVAGLQGAGDIIDKATGKIREQNVVLLAQRDVFAAVDPHAKVLAELHKEMAQNAARATTEWEAEAAAVRKLGEGSAKVIELKAAIGALNATADENSLVKYMQARSAQITAEFMAIDPYTGRPKIAPNDPYATNFTLPTRSSADILARLGMQSDDLASIEAKKTGTALGHAHGEEVRRLLLDQQFVGQFGGAMAGIFESGGRNFVQILSSGLSSSVQESAQSFSRKIFGAPGDASSFVFGTDRHQDPNRLYDAAGNDITGRAKTGRAVATGAESAAGGYQAGLSGQDGSRTGAVAGAFLSGMSTGNIYLAIGAAIVAEIAGALGAAKRQADYQYGIPSIDASGIAHFGQAQNYTDAAAKKITQQLQDTYDQTRGSALRALMGMNAPIPGVTPIDGKFQDNPSGHFPEHLQLFTSQTLPHEVLEQLKGNFRQGYEGLGVTTGRFEEIWARLNTLDPTKMLALLDQLGAGLGAMAKVAIATHYQDPRGNQDSFLYGMNEASLRSRMTPGGMLSEYDAEIEKLAHGLKALPLGDQIAAIAQIGQLQTQRYDAEKQAILELFNLQKQVNEQLRGDLQSLDVMGMVKPDGSADHYAIAQYYKAHADASLGDIRQARNATELSADWTHFEQYVMAAVREGIAQDPAGAKAWTAWAQKALGTGKSAFDSEAVAIGVTMSVDDAKLNAAVDPEIDAFKKQLHELTKDIGGGITDPESPINKLPIVIRDDVIPQFVRLGEVTKGLANAFGILTGQDGGLVTTMPVDGGTATKAAATAAKPDKDLEAYQNLLAAQSWTDEQRKAAFVDAYGSTATTVPGWAISGLRKEAREQARLFDKYGWPGDPNKVTTGDPQKIVATGGADLGSALQEPIGPAINLGASLRALIAAVDAAANRLDSLGTGGSGGSGGGGGNAVHASDFASSTRWLRSQG